MRNLFILSGSPEPTEDGSFCLCVRFVYKRSPDRGEDGYTTIDNEITVAVPADQLGSWRDVVRNEIDQRLRAMGAGNEGLTLDSVVQYWP